MKRFLFVIATAIILVGQQAAAEAQLNTQGNVASSAKPQQGTAEQEHVLLQDAVLACAFPHYQSISVREFLGAATYENYAEKIDALARQHEGTDATLFINLEVVNTETKTGRCQGVQVRLYADPNKQPEVKRLYPDAGEQDSCSEQPSLTLSVPVPPTVFIPGDNGLIVQIFGTGFRLVDARTPTCDEWFDIVQPYPEFFNLVPIIALYTGLSSLVVGNLCHFPRGLAEAWTKMQEDFSHFRTDVTGACPPPGLHHFTLSTERGSRHYSVYVPDGASQPGNRLATLYNFHGVLSNGAQHETTSGFHALADETDAFISVYIDGTAVAGLGPAWNAGGIIVGDAPDDEAVFRAVSEQIEQWSCVDPYRRYAAGHSIGGAFVQLLAEQGLITAGASVNGVRVTDPANRPIKLLKGVPLVLFHGERDSVFPVDNKNLLSPFVGIGMAQHGFPTANDNFAEWAFTQCNTEVTPTIEENWKTTDTAQCRRSTCDVDIVMCVVPGQGHEWFTEQANGLDVSREIWSFLRQYTNEGPKRVLQ